MNIPIDRGASPFGYHFLTEYLQCPRRWFLHHILGLEDPTPKPSLLFGKVWHTALELLLQDHPTEEVYPLVNEMMLRDRRLYPNDEEFTKRQRWLLHGLPVWQKQTVMDLKDFEILTVEDDFIVPLAEGFQFSVRTDGRARSPDGKVYILEHKTTSYGFDKMLTTVDYEDQVTGYMLAYKIRYPNEPLDGVLVDVTAFKANDITTQYAVVTRCQEDLVNFHFTLVGLFTELRQKQLAVKEGRNPFELFPRNGAWCSMFGCPYIDVCRRRLEQLSLPLTDNLVVTEPSTIE